MNEEQMRTVLFAYIRRHLPPQSMSVDEAPFQMSPMREPLAKIASELGMFPSGSPKYLERDDWALANDVIWQLFTENILRPGDSNVGQTTFYPTKYGVTVIRQALSAYDSGTYFGRLRSAIANPDQIVITYLEEAIRTFRMGCSISPAVCLGCASERAFELLIDSYCDTLPSLEREKFEKRLGNRFIKTLVDEFRKDFDLKKAGFSKDSTLGKKAVEALDFYIGGMMQIIRYQRNDAGHPTGRRLDREQVYVSINSFIPQLESVCTFIAYFQANKIP